MTPIQEKQLRLEAAKRGYSPEKVEQFVQFAKQKEAKSQPEQTDKTAQPASQGSTFMDRLKGSFTGGVDKVKAGFQQSKDASSGNFVQKNVGAVEGALKVGSGALSALFSPVTALAQPVIDKTVAPVFNKVTDTISSNPSVQRFAASKAGQVTSRVAEDVGNFSDIAGAFSGPKGASNVLNRGKQALADVGDDVARMADDTVRVAKEPVTNSVQSQGSRVFQSKATPSTLKQAVDDTIKAGKDTISGFISSIDEPTKSALNPSRLVPEERLSKLNPVTAAKNADNTKGIYDKYLKQAQQSATDMSKPSALDLAGQRADDALRAIQEKMNRAGELKKTVLSEVGDRVLPGVGKFRDRLQTLIQDRLGVRITKDGVKDALGRVSKVDASDHSLLKEVDDLLAKIGDNPTYQVVDDVIDQIQDKIYRRKANQAVQVSDKVEAVLKQVTGELNNRLKIAAGKTYGKANKRYSDMIDTFDKLNKALGLDASKGGSLMKRIFSPTDGGTKKLFQDIKKITGIDLTTEATLAKLAMDTVGDPRSRSLLEALDLLKPTGALGWMEKAGQFIVDKAKDPVREARSLIEQGRQRKR